MQLREHWRRCIKSEETKSYHTFPNCFFMPTEIIIGFWLRFSGPLRSLERAASYLGRLLTDFCRQSNAQAMLFKLQFRIRKAQRLEGLRGSVISWINIKLEEIHALMEALLWARVGHGDTTVNFVRVPYMQFRFAYFAYNNSALIRLEVRGLAKDFLSEAKRMIPSGKVVLVFYKAIKISVGVDSSLYQRNISVQSYRWLIRRCLHKISCYIIWFPDWAVFNEGTNHEMWRITGRGANQELTREIDESCFDIWNFWMHGDGAQTKFNYTSILVKCPGFPPLIEIYCWTKIFLQKILRNVFPSQCLLQSFYWYCSITKVRTPRILGSYTYTGRCNSNFKEHVQFYHTYDLQTGRSFLEFLDFVL